MAKLAINGGEKVIDRPLGKGWPMWDEREERALLEVLHSGNWSSRITEFEDAFAEYHDAKYGTATN
jgi:dTDP-4-amino-4,6-dideoxygalactose transaminase